MIYRGSKTMTITSWITDSEGMKGSVIAYHVPTQSCIGVNGPRPDHLQRNLIQRRQEDTQWWPIPNNWVFVMHRFP